MTSPSATSSFSPPAMPTTITCPGRQREARADAVTAAWIGPIPAGLVTRMR